ncbi:MAG: hypothetical protein K0Q95_1001 [Bacteroidota bacterium]|jgi:hypothetical protein|nr:hypothetical protein [Bacteroidota bacterium]
MTEISALELFGMLISGVLFYFVFKIVETNWDFKNAHMEEPLESANDAAEKELYKPRLVILRNEEKEEILAGRLVNFSLDTHEMAKEKEEEILLVKY